MRVLRYLGPRQVEIGELPRPTIETGEVLVRTRACGVCATDVKTYMRGHPKIPAGAVLGHEMSGVIAESRAGGWHTGERVVVAPYVPCGECLYCRRRQFTLCEHLFDSSVEPGGFSEFFRVPARVVEVGMHHLPNEVDLTVGSLAEPLACCYHGLEALQLHSKESILIVGDGPMGLMQTLIAREIGAEPIVLAGLTAERLAWGASHADQLVNVAEKNLQDQIMAFTHGQGVDKVIVSVGQAEVAEQAVSLVRRGGAINFFAGLPSGSRVNLDPNRIHYDQIVLVGTFGFAPDHFKLAVDLLVKNTASVTSLITHQVSLDGLEGAFADSARYLGIKTVVVFE